MSDAPKQQPKTAEAKKSGGIIKFLFWFMFLSFLLAGMALYLMKASFLEMFNTYRPKTVISTFSKYRDLQVKGNMGNILEVATGEETITLTQQDSLQIYGKEVPGIRTVSQIHVPATFRYHIDLKGEWRLVEDGHKLRVLAPSLRPSLPVAFDSAKMEKINPGWSRYITGDNMGALEKSITPNLEGKAKDLERIVKFESEARKSVAHFVQTWLVDQGQWGEGRFEEIIVYFDANSFDSESKKLIDQPLEFEESKL